MKVRKPAGRASQNRKSLRSPRVVIISGLSGSGKTVALRAVEDLNFFCVDNLPVSLIGSLISRTAADAGIKDIAIGVDIREKEFLSAIDRILRGLRTRYRVEIVFLEAETEVLVRRFKETRRPHPLGGELEGAIMKERVALSGLRDNADRVIDSSSFSPHQLRKTIFSLYGPRSGLKDMTVTLISFGFKFGAPQNIDLLFDVRFLPNPNFVRDLKPLNGTDRRVAAYVFRQPETREFMKKLKQLIEFLIPLYVREGKSYLSIAVGCTGGNHRSPAIVEKMAAFVRKSGVDLRVIHRDMS